MRTEVIQVRDVAAEDAQALRARAASLNMSLSAYLRQLIHDDVSRPTMAQTLARITTRDGVEASTEDIRSFIDADQR